MKLKNYMFLWIFWARVFHYGGWWRGQGDHSVKKWPNPPSIESQFPSSEFCPPNFYFHFLPIKVLATPPPLLLPEMGHSSNKVLKIVNWNCNQQNELIFKGILKYFFARGMRSYKNLQFMTMKTCHKQKTRLYPCAASSFFLIFPYFLGS